MRYFFLVTETEEQYIVETNECDLALLTSVIHNQEELISVVRLAPEYVNHDCVKHYVSKDGYFH